MGQHLIQIIQHALQKLALGARLHRGEQYIAECPTVFQEEHGKNRHNQKHPRLFGNVGNPQANALRQLGDVIFVVYQERAHQFAAALAPTVLTELLCDLAGTQLVQQSRQGLSKPRSLSSDLWPHGDEEQHHQPEQQCIDDSNGAAAPFQQFLEIVHHRADQVGKKNGEQEGNQSLAGHVQESQGQREQQYRDQGPRRTCINQQQGTFSRYFNSPAPNLQSRTTSVLSAGIAIRMSLN